VMLSTPAIRTLVNGDVIYARYPYPGKW